MKLVLLAAFVLSLVVGANAGAGMLTCSDPTSDLTISTSTDCDGYVMLTSEQFRTSFHGAVTSSPYFYRGREYKKLAFALNRGATLTLFIPASNPDGSYPNSNGESPFGNFDWESQEMGGNLICTVRL